MKRILAVLLCLFLAAGTAGCSSDNRVLSGSGGSSQNEIELYYLNETEDQLEHVPYVMTEPDQKSQVAELIGEVSQEPPDKHLRSLLPKGVEITNSGKVDGSTLTLDLSENVNHVESSRRTLMVGGLVRTFLQIQGLKKMKITAGGHSLTDSYGNEVGVLTSSSFVENEGKSINSYQHTTMTLYFADKTGKKLVPEVRTVTYSSNEPIERAVVEALISGPEESGHGAVLPSDATILGTNSQNGVCYVNFGQNVQNPMLNVNSELSLYAVVNSLIDTVPRIKKVQFSIEGTSSGQKGGGPDLSVQYSRNEEMIGQS